MQIKQKQKRFSQQQTTTMKEKAKQQHFPKHHYSNDH